MSQALVLADASEVNVDLALRDEVYHATDAVSASGLAAAMRSPKHFLARNQIEATPSMDLGSAIHDALLTPERYAEKYAEWRKVGSRAKNPLKQEWDAFKEANQSKTILDREQCAALDGMRDAVLGSKTASRLLAGSTFKEVSIFWKWAGMTASMKARPDGIHANGILWDLKSTQDASPYNFSRTIFNGKYHMQLALYRLAVNLAIERGLLPGIKPITACCIVAVESEAPYGVAVYQLEESALAAGQAEALIQLAKLEECYATNNFPGYPDEPTFIDLPKWARNQ